MQNTLTQHADVLSIDTCTGLAEDLLGQYRCEWMLSPKQSCGKILASYTLLSKHVHTHTKFMKKVKDRGYIPCAYGRCSHRAPTQEDLWYQHVLPNHLQRIELQCPVQSCTTKAVSALVTRGTSMGQHFLHAHSDLFGREIRFPSEFLRPSACPMPLGPVLQPPPPLPCGPVLPSLLLASVQPHPSQHTLALENSASTSSRIIGVLPTIPQRARRKQLEPEEEQVDLCTIEFDDFEPGRISVSDNASGAPIFPRQNIVTHPAPFRTEVSRPPVLVQPPKVLEPPPSILYHAWEIEVDKRLPPEPQEEDDDDDGPSEPDSDYDSEDCDPTPAHMPLIVSSTGPPANATGSSLTPSSSHVATQGNRDARYADRGTRKRTADSPPETCSARPSKSRRTSMQDISDLAADLHLDT